MKSTKKTKSTTLNTKHLDQLAVFGKNKKIAFILFFTLLVIFCSVSGYMYYASKADKDNIIKMREDVAKLTERISAIDSSVDWDNNSSCTVSRPKSFQDNVGYSCNAQYVHARPIRSQDDVNKLIGTISAALNDSADIITDVKDNSTNSVRISDNPDQNSYYNATSFMLTDVQLDKGACYLRYIISDTKDSLMVNVECLTSARQAYFKPIQHI